MRGPNHDHANLGGSNRILNLQHAAEHLDMPAERLRLNWKRWQIPAYKAGRELRFRERDLNAWLTRQRAA